MKIYRKLLHPWAVPAALALFILFNLTAATVLRPARLDLTENRLYTLTEGTAKILQSLEEPITLEFYLARESLRTVPALEAFAQRVENLLEEYARVGGERVRLEKYDPEPFSEAEDRALERGLQGLPTTAANLYFGLAVVTADGRREVISFFQPDRERFLEYDITRMIHQLAHPQKIAVGLLSALPLTGGADPQNPFAMQRPWMIGEELRDRFDLRTLPQDSAAIPGEIDVLMVVLPSRFGEKTLYAIDQFVLRGGRALVFVDPFSEAGARTQGPALDDNPTVAKLLAAWGVAMDYGQVVGDLGSAQQVAAPGQLRSQVIQFLPWLALGEDAPNRDDIISAQLAQINMASAGALRPLSEATTGFVPLLQSSSDAMLIAREEIAFAPDPAQLLARFHSQDERFTLAARVSGALASAFPQGPPPAGKDSGQGAGGEEQPAEPPPHLVRSQIPAQLVVVADSDLLQDRFWVEVGNVLGQRLAIPVAANADLVVNALEQLGGSSDLISVRSRGSYARPFTLVEQIQREAEQRYRAREQELLARLQQTEGRLNELQRQRADASSPVLSPAQERELERFRSEAVRTRQELREVQYRLREDIAELETLLKVFNIGLVPLLIALAAFIAWVVRRHRGRGYAD